MEAAIEVIVVGVLAGVFIDRGVMCKRGGEDGGFDDLAAGLDLYGKMIRAVVAVLDISEVGADVGSWGEFKAIHIKRAGDSGFEVEAVLVETVNKIGLPFEAMSDFPSEAEGEIPFLGGAAKVVDVGEAEGGVPGEFRDGVEENGLEFAFGAVIGKAGPEFEGVLVVGCGGEEGEDAIVAEGFAAF